VSLDNVRLAIATIANGKDSLKSHRLVERVAKRAKIPVDECSLAMEEIRRNGGIECDWFNGSPLGNVQVNLPPPKNVQIRADWCAEIARHKFSGSTKKLMGCPIVLDGRSHAEVIGALERLVEFQDSGMLLREVSSRLFWGLSKVLDTKEQVIAELLGLDNCPFPEKPISIMVHIPSENPQGVLFIENEVSFLSACRGRIDGTRPYILLFASGYKTGTPRLRKDGGAVFFFSPSSFKPTRTRDDFTRWIYGDDDLWPVFFWGDLDLSGMGILKALRKVFPSLESWKAGYISMLDAIENGKGHTPKEAGKEKQEDPGNTGCEYADSVLLPALRKHQRFLDQE